ncbi:unnamed protein product [Rotaria magnacalcarata]
MSLHLWLCFHHTADITATKRTQSHSNSAPIDVGMRRILIIVLPAKLLHRQLIQTDFQFIDEIDEENFPLIQE